MKTHTHTLQPASLQVNTMFAIEHPPKLDPLDCIKHLYGFCLSKESLQLRIFVLAVAYVLIISATVQHQINVPQKVKSVNAAGINIHTQAGRIVFLSTILFWNECQERRTWAASESKLQWRGWECRGQNWWPSMMGESSSNGKNAETEGEGESAEIVWCSFHPSGSVAIGGSTFMQQSIELPCDLSGFLLLCVCEVER